MFTLNFYKILSIDGNAEQAIKYYKTYGGETENTNGNSNTRYSLMMESTFSPRANSQWCQGIEDNISTEQELIESYHYKYMSGGTMVNNGNMQSIQPLIMILGDGTTAPTKLDYKLEHFIGSDKLQCTQKTYERNMIYTADSDTALTHSWTFQNITNEPVTVKEVGLAFKTCESNSYDHHYDEYNFTVLIAREVLSSPVTIAPNAKYTFDFAFTF